jgi:DNA-binding winged helix-turn-helix (wHTH) protein
VRTYAFQSFKLDLDKRELRRRGYVEHVTPQTFRILCYLAEHADRRVSVMELKSEIWPGQRCDTARVYTAMQHVRVAIGQARGENWPIDSKKGEGHRLVCEVKRTGVAPPPSTPRTRESWSRYASSAAKAPQRTAVECMNMADEIVRGEIERFGP